MSGKLKEYLPLALIAGAAMAIYGQVLGHGFVVLDDGLYVYMCAHVLEGMTWKGFLWAWSNFDAGNYHPLTWLSYMADVSLFGPEPGRMAFENACLHCINGWLVWHLFKALGCSRLGAFMGALAFILHPVNVESVAWISQRKTLLAAAFGLGSVNIYVARAQQGRVPTNGAVVLCFIASLLAKASFVPLPAFLFVFDIIYLRRLERREDGLEPFRNKLKGIWTLIKQKLVLGLVMLAAMASAVIAQRSVGALASVEKFSLPFRLQNTLVSTFSYFTEFFVPHHLSIFYPYPAGYSTLHVSMAAIGLLLVLVAMVFSWRGYPEITCGGAWFFLFLLPVCGLVQVGDQSRADRYMYIPVIGLIWILVRGGERLWDAAVPALRFSLVAIVAVWLGFTSFVAYQQASYWKNTYLLATHSIASVGPAPMLQGLLGYTYLDIGEPRLALPLFRELAYRKKPDIRDVLAYATALHDCGNLQEAISVCERVAAFDRHNYYAYAYLSQWLAEAGKPDLAAQAAAQMRKIGPPFGHVPFEPTTQAAPKVE